MKLEMLVRERETNLADFISEIVGAYLDAQEHDAQHLTQQILLREEERARCLTS